MLYQLNYEGQVCLSPSSNQESPLVNALSTELWSTCLPCLLRPIKTISGEYSINWTMKHMPALSPSSNQDNLWWMLYQLTYEAHGCPVSIVQSRQSLVNALSTELWSTCLPCLHYPIKTISGEYSINWTMKHMPALSPSSNQDNLWWMLYRLNYQAQVRPFSFVQSRQSLVNALSTELWSTSLPCLLPPIKSIWGECSINWTMKHMPAPVSFVQSRQSLVNALSTELWSTRLPCLLRPIKTISGKCSINWTMKHKSALTPSSNQENLWWMLYQLNYEAHACPVSFVQSRQSLVNALSTQLWSTRLPCLHCPIKTVSGKCSINWTMKRMAALSASSNQDNLW